MGIKITDFFNTDYISWANYDNYRKIPNLCDGQKVSARKTLYTMISQKIKDPIKVSRLKSKVAEFTGYLHGEDALIGVIVGLAQRFIGSNNITLLKGEGNFGLRVDPAASADRYIFAAIDSICSKLFRQEDFPILQEQFFEGEKIEPKFFVPVLPLLLINGSMDALSIGFTSNILPRNPRRVAEEIFKILDGKQPDRIEPWFKGFQGAVVRNEEGGLETRGIFEKTGPKDILILDLPLGITLAKYREILDQLEDKKIITSWKDLSETKKDYFKFKVKLAKVIPDNQIASTLKLIKKLSENYTCFDENIQLQIFENELGILQNYVKVRLDFYQKRKEYQIQQLEHELKVLKNKSDFIKAVISSSLIVFKRKRADIEADLEKMKLDRIDESYDYLLNMQISQLTKEKLDKFIEDFKRKKKELEDVKAKDCKEWWKTEINEALDALGEEKL